MKNNIIIQFRNFILPFMLIILLNSCAPRSYFTYNLKQKLQSNDISISKIQFYVDQGLELKREMSKTEASVNSGKLKIEGGKTINIIILKKNTPGACTKVDGDTLFISFENGQNKELKFVTLNGSVKDPYALFSLPGDEKHRSIIYDNNLFFINPNITPKLMIKKQYIEKLYLEKRNMAGRVVN